MNPIQESQPGAPANALLQTIDAPADLRKLSRAVEESPESIVITNTRAEIEYVNQAFVNKTGYSRAEAIGQNPRVLQSGRTTPETYRSLWDTVTAGRSWSGEFFNRRKDGTDYLEHVTITPIHDDSGAGYGWDVVKNSWSGPQFDLSVKDDPEPRLPAQGWITNEVAQKLFADNGLKLEDMVAAANRKGFKAVA